jgi:pyroglutamyl-peptidase
MGTRILLTGFEPFGPHAVNPSQRVVERIRHSAPAGVVLSTCLLPVTWDAAFERVREALVGEQLHGLLMLGLGAGRAEVQFERFAVNWRGAALQDNAGRRIDGEPIDAEGPAAYFATVPVETLVGACLAAGVPADVSSHAGTYLCNEVMYRGLRCCDQQNLGTRVGFTHLPLLPEQAGPDEPSLAEDLQVTAIRAALERLAHTPPGATFGA